MGPDEKIFGSSRAWLAAAAMVALVGCALNPVSGRPELVLQSTAKERQIGLEESEKVARFVGLVEDPALVAYVRRVGERLARHSPRQDVTYTFNIADTPEPNAFALPGGYVYVSRGLLALVNSEDELAGVIGHEIGHVAARHSVGRMTLATPFALAAAIPGLLVGIVSPTLGKVAAAPGALAGGLVLAPYSRSQESQADRIGVEMAAQAGWDPAAISSFLATLEREETLAGGEQRRASFFDSHPSTPRRVAATAELGRKTPRAELPPVASGSGGVLDVLDGLLLGDDPGHGVFLGERFLHPELGFRVTFPKGWATRNAAELVAAAAGGGAAVAMLQIVQEGDDPLAAAGALEEKARVVWVDEPLGGRISGRPAARAVADARTGRGPTRLDLAWVALGGRVYQLTGMTERERFDAYRPLFTGFTESFASLGEAERAEIQVTRLRVVEARGGERLAALLERTQSSWEPEMAAAANAIAVDARLSAGQRVKVAIPGPYSEASDG